MAFESGVVSKRLEKKRENEVGIKGYHLIITQGMVGLQVPEQTKGREQLPNQEGQILTLCVMGK